MFASLSLKSVKHDESLNTSFHFTRKNMLQISICLLNSCNLGKLHTRKEFKKLSLHFTLFSPLNKVETLLKGGSLLEPLHCDPPFRGHPFFRSYGVSLPSSLERVLSRPLVFSTNLPVSVSGTGHFCVFFQAA